MKGAIQRKGGKGKERRGRVSRAGKERRVKKM